MDVRVSLGVWAPAWLWVSGCQRGHEGQRGHGCRGVWVPAWPWVSGCRRGCECQRAHGCQRGRGCRGVRVSVGVWVSGCQCGHGCQGASVAMRASVAMGASMAMGARVAVRIRVSGCQRGHGSAWPWVSGCQHGRGHQGVWVPAGCGCQRGRGCRAQVRVLGRGCRSGSSWQLASASTQVPGPGTASGRGLCPAWRGRSGEVGCLLLEELSLRCHEMWGGVEVRGPSGCPVRLLPPPWWVPPTLGVVFPCGCSTGSQAAGGAAGLPSPKEKNQLGCEGGAGQSRKAGWGAGPPNVLSPTGQSVAWGLADACGLPAGLKALGSLGGWVVPIHQAGRPHLVCPGPCASWW